jgi:hypothetical protein
MIVTVAVRKCLGFDRIPRTDGLCIDFPGVCHAHAQRCLHRGPVSKRPRLPPRLNSRRGCPEMRQSLRFHFQSQSHVLNCTVLFLPEIT